MLDCVGTNLSPLGVLSTHPVTVVGERPRFVATTLIYHPRSPVKSAWLVVTRTTGPSARCDQACQPSETTLRPKATEARTSDVCTRTQCHRRTTCSGSSAWS